MNDEIKAVLRLMGEHFKKTDNLKACRPASHVMMALMEYDDDPSEARLERVRQAVAELRKHVPEH